jgi:hypothetical protein
MIGNVGFDPWGLSTPQNIKWMREAELKHGRMCQMAWLVSSAQQQCNSNAAAAAAAADAADAADEEGTHERRSRGGGILMRGGGGRKQTGHETCWTRESFRDSKAHASMQP